MSEAAAPDGAPTEEVQKLRAHAAALEDRLRERTDQLERAVEERMRAERSLRKGEERFRRTFDDSPIAGAVMGVNGRLRRVNQKLCELTGYTVEELASRRFSDLLHPDDVEAELRQTARLLSGELDQYTRENRFVRCDGAILWVKITVRLIRLEDGRPLYFLPLVENISESRLLQQRAVRLQKLESTGRLAAGIAHDYNNILTAIIGNISLAKKFLTREHKAYERLDRAEDASLRALELTQKFITFSTGGDPIKRRLSIRRLVLESAELTLAGSNVRCDFLAPSDIWPAEVDERQIGQVVSNIVDNARQSMPGGGVVTVGLENVLIDGSGTEGYPELSAGRYVRITIRDHGAGIDNDSLPHLFDPYFSSEGLATEKGKGLGLAIAHSVVTKHGGQIEIESEVHEGTTVAIHLPACREEIQSEITPTELDSPQGLRVLVVDDEDVVREVANEMLTHLGYSVFLASEGKEALRIYEEHRERGAPIDVVILDLTIPGGMGGVETLRRLITIDPTVKAVVSSGYSHDPVMTNFRDHGFAGVLPKPYLTEELDNVLAELFSGERADQSDPLVPSRP